MLTVRETRDIEAYINLGYSSDIELTKRWHVIAGSSLSECVTRTVEDLKNDTHPDFTFYAVYNGDRFFGYFGVEANKHYLTTIYVHPDFRKDKANKLEFWNLIGSYLNPKFYSAIYNKNTPCMKFFSKLGKIKSGLETKDGPATLFEFDRSSLCH